jgi:hypothetical protein
MRNEHRKISDMISLGEFDRQSISWRRSLKSDREKHNLPLGMVSGDLKRVQRTVNHTHIAPRSLDT